MRKREKKKVKMKLRITTNIIGQINANDLRTVHYQRKTQDMYVGERVETEHKFNMFV